MSGKIFIAFFIFGMIFHQSNGCWGTGTFTNNNNGGLGKSSSDGDRNNNNNNNNNHEMDNDGRSYQNFFNYFLQPQRCLSFRQSESMKFFLWPN